ncbi:hypothetical protein GCM10022221_48860 [Actinocorallia aurea]
MYPVSCRYCGLTVEVKKNSLAHTEIQWTTDTGECVELESGSPLSVLRSLRPTCRLLRDSVEAAVRDGAIPVGEGTEENDPAGTRNSGADGTKESKERVS